MVINEKYNFWKKMFFFTVLSLFVGFVLLSTELNENISVIPMVIFMILLVTCRIGMAYNAYKLKRYGWMIVNLILGEIFWIIFLFTVLKHTSRPKKKKKRAKKKSPSIN